MRPASMGHSLGEERVRARGGGQVRSCVTCTRGALGVPALGRSGRSFRGPVVWNMCFSNCVARRRLVSKHAPLILSCVFESSPKLPRVAAPADLFDLLSRLLDLLMCTTNEVSQ